MRRDIRLPARSRRRRLRPFRPRRNGRCPGRDVRIPHGRLHGRRRKRRGSRSRAEAIRRHRGRHRQLVGGNGRRVRRGVPLRHLRQLLDGHPLRRDLDRWELRDPDLGRRRRVHAVVLSGRLRRAVRRRVPRRGVLRSGRRDVVQPPCRRRHVWHHDAHARCGVHLRHSDDRRDHTPRGDRHRGRRRDHVPHAVSLHRSDYRRERRVPLVRASGRDLSGVRVRHPALPGHDVRRIRRLRVPVHARGFDDHDARDGDRLRSGPGVLGGVHRGPRAGRRALLPDSRPVGQRAGSPLQAGDRRLDRDRCRPIGQQRVLRSASSRLRVVPDAVRVQRGLAPVARWNCRRRLGTRSGPGVRGMLRRHRGTRRQLRWLRRDRLRHHRGPRPGGRLRTGAGSVIRRIGAGARAGTDALDGLRGGSLVAATPTPTPTPTPTSSPSPSSSPTLRAEPQPDADRNPCRQPGLRRVVALADPRGHRRADHLLPRPAALPPAAEQRPA